jgi:radical SAM superfamily enzyme YgiQ (UPF0313 family)
MKIERVTLVRRETENTGVYASFSHPGLALPIIGTVLKHSGYNVKIYIDSIQPPPMEELYRSDVVGFSVNSACFLETYRAAKQLREKSKCIIVFGGPHVTFMADEALRYGDFVVRGEGEQTIIELFHALEEDRSSFDNINGLSWRDSSGQIHHNPDRPLHPNPDTIPDQSLIAGYKKSMRHISNKLFPKAMLVSASRGCPFECTFCMIPQTFGKTIRYRDIDSVITDIRQQLEFSGNKYIYFTDDNFAINSGYTKELLKRIIKERLGIRFSAQVRCEITLDQELMDLMKAAGSYLVFVGFESINDETLKLYNKGGKQTRDQIERSIIEFHKRNIKIHGMFVAGADTDEPGSVVSTAKWAFKQNIDSFQVLPICPLPGTVILKQLESQNRVIKVINPDTNKSYIPYGTGNNVVYLPKNMSATELQKEVLTAYKLFYNYRNILKRMRFIFNKGIEPIIYQFIGCKLIQIAKPEINRYLEWLHSATEYKKNLSEPF